MDTVKLIKKDVKVIAHRGLSGIETENTNSAFVAAGNRSYWGIETDIHKTTDGFYVIFHDDNTGRMTNKDLAVEEVTYKELCELTLNDTNGKQGRRDLIIPLLGDYISICKKYNKHAVLELKNSFKHEDIKEIVAYLNEKCGTHYRCNTANTRKHITARFADGYTVSDFIKVIDKKSAEWQGTKFELYLRPDTLFGSKFESYLNQQIKQKDSTKEFLGSWGL